MQEVKNKILVSKDMLIEKIIQIENKLVNLNQHNEISHELSNFNKSDFFVVNTKGEILFVSDGIEELLRVNRSDLLDRNIGDIQNNECFDKNNFKKIEYQTEESGIKKSIYI